MMNEEEIKIYFKRHPAEQEVFQLKCDGYNCEQIAKIRKKSPATIRHQFDDIRHVFETEDITRAVACGISMGVIVVRFIGE
jgi:DNA-binding CsgD family transcriptional regulator